MLCDPRLSTKGYGNVIRDSLPDFPWVYEADLALKMLTNKSSEKVK
ncbi:hypothetical protein [Thiomicrorhabdus sp.]